MNDSPAPESYPDVVAAARRAQAEGDLAEAASIYRRIIGQFPHKRHGIVLAAQGLRKCGYWTEAVAVLEHALKQAPVSAAILTTLAEFYREVGDHGRAAGFLKRHIDHDPSSSDSWFELGRLYYMAGDWGNAESAFTRATTLSPLSINAVLSLGDSRFQLGKRDEALACYRRAVTTQPDNADAHFKLGSALMRMRHDTEALQHLRQSLVLDPAIAGAHANLGLIHLRAGRMIEALESANAALQIDENLQVAHVLRGTVLTEQGEFDVAASALSRVAQTTENAETLFLLSAAEAARGERLAAELALQRILAAQPDNSEARHYLAALHGEAITTPITGFARDAFDRIALHYDDRELNISRYQAHEELTRLLEDIQPERRSIERLLDIGCGTGLVTMALRDAFNIPVAIGIDASPEMARIAATKSFYEQIFVGDAVEELRRTDGRFDVIAAVDVFPYVGDLAALIGAAAAKLMPDGILGYSIELAPGSKWGLAAAGRFVHSEEYLVATAREAGLESIGTKQITLRRSMGRNVSGLVGLLRRPV